MRRAEQPPTKTLTFRVPLADAAAFARAAGRRGLNPTDLLRAYVRETARRETARRA